MKKHAKLLVTFKLLLLVFCWLPKFATADNKTILVIGDSISAAYGMDVSEGWVALLQDRLTRKSLNYSVVNASISGDVSASAANRTEALLEMHQPDWVIIEIGGNDGLRGLPIRHLQENLQSIIVQSQAQGAQVLLTGMQIFPNYGPRYTESFKKTYIELANEWNIALVPFILDGVGGNSALIQVDGVHPTAQAQPILLDNVWAVLEPLLLE